MSKDGTHLIVCKSELALQYLIQESCLLGLRAKNSISVSQGDALVARDILQEIGFEWDRDFYIKKLMDNKTNDSRNQSTPDH